ncbi:MULTISPECIES: fumarylacetoacetate hydrolase family protein [unclassified Nocardioides]|uniref:fumarylacetoacetate hydrolase family protein n=1 Tax=unclassified Nocardioides TaxID=2615069 RepID=UPI0009F121E3|nr:MULTISPECIES: fumarylacetoacetate hydrolase family protein [unclassified Nocardioides]GAW50129.1 2-hydroxyhepta-2,4-diene-1,7-dioate isomerase [Nocardioides sp. PD653-B2]GAW54814.1 2-hydroxyhepta-2,4-diene-1,7-dioate isomerase [Nocardioides sp. PD653]
MKFARSRTAAGVTPVIEADGHWYDLTPIAPDIDATVIALDSQADIRTAIDNQTLPPTQAPVAYAAPLSGIGKIVCIGLNYRDHAEETGATPPDEPVIFMKAPDTVVGPDDEVLVPRRSVKTDYEVELAVVIGRTTRYLDSPADALRHVAGYAISHDVSEREFQIERGGQWDKGKNCETFNPFGPWICTTDELTDPQDLALRLWVNGELRQDGNTKNMIFGVDHVVWYVSQFMTLYPGDVINTGTPAGVAMGRPGQPYLRPADVVELEIDGLGRQRQLVGQA